MATVSGTVHPQECSNRAGIAVEFEFRPLDGNPSFSRIVSLSGDGTFTLPNIPRKNYTLHVKANKWLAKNLALGTFGGDMSGLDVALLGGDANNDNSVDALDLSDLINAFNTESGQLDYNAAADLNCDDGVDALDLAILIDNFNTEGDS